jgi:hypothetical protein
MKVIKTSSQYKGVTWHKRDRKWTAAIRVNGKRKYLGYFNTENAAGAAYDEAVLEHFGRTNGNG